MFGEAILDYDTCLWMFRKLARIKPWLRPRLRAIPDASLKAGFARSRLTLKLVQTKFDCIQRCECHNEALHSATKSRKFLRKAASIGPIEI